MSTNEIRDDIPGKRSKARWYVHLGLLALLTTALITLIYLSVSVSIHAIAGLAFVAFVLLHLFQRRRTVTRLVAQLTRIRSKVERKVGLAFSDAVLTFVFLNVLLSGVVDWIGGVPVQLPFAPPFNTWHKASGIVLVAYLGFHVWHRRRRFRRSVIR